VSGKPAAATRDDLGFLLAKASQRWNERLQESFAAAGFPEVRSSFGSLLVPLFEEDGLRMGELAARARLSKQTMTTMIRLLERDGLVDRRPDPDDRRAARVFLTARARAFQPVAENVLAELEREAVQELGDAATARTRKALRRLAGIDPPGGGIPRGSGVGSAFAGVHERSARGLPGEAAFRDTLGSRHPDRARTATT
jgi:DNA-binding MarR family transcriptional regulator